MALSDRTVTSLPAASVPPDPDDVLYIVQDIEAEFPEPRKIRFGDIGSIPQSVIDDIEADITALANVVAADIDEVNDTIDALQSTLESEISDLSDAVDDIAASAIQSDGSIHEIVIITRDDYDAIAPGTTGWVYLVRPEA